MVSNVLHFTFTIYTLLLFIFKTKKKETIYLKKNVNIKLIQTFTKLNYDHEKVWRIYTFQDHPHYFLMSQNEPLVGGNIKCSYQIL